MKKEEQQKQKTKKEKPTKKKKNNPPKIWFKPAIRGDLDYFVEDISMLVGSGMSIPETLDTIQKEFKSKKMQKIVLWMKEEVASGSSFAESLKQVNLFPSYTVSLIRVGEESGQLSENLALTSEQYKKDRFFHSKIRSALMYPVFVLVLTLVVGTGIAWFILPRLAQVFGQLNIELPLITQILINSGQFLADYGGIAIPVFFIVIFLILYFTFFFSKTKFIGQSILFKLPGTGSLIKQIEVARFSYLLGSLLKAGLPITQALESLSEAASFFRYRDFYDYLKVSVEEGNSFDESFSNYEGSKKLIPSSVQQLIIAGENSGKLPESLGQTNESYEEKVEITTKNLTVILEPILLVIVWLGVMAVALAVIFPIYSLIGDLNL